MVDLREISFRFGLSHTLGKAESTAAWAMVHGLSQSGGGEARLAHSTHMLSFGYEKGKNVKMLSSVGPLTTDGQPGKPRQYNVTTVWRRAQQLWDREGPLA